MTVQTLRNYLDTYQRSTLYVQKETGLSRQRLDYLLDTDQELLIDFDVKEDSINRIWVQKTKTLYPIKKPGSLKG